MFYGYCCLGPRGRFYPYLYILHILDCLGQVNAGFIQVLYLGRAPHTKETLPDFRERCRVTRHSRVFRRLTGSQRTPGFGASHPYPPFLLGQQIVIAILGTVTRGPDCWSFHLSPAPVPIADSTGELLTGCLGGQSVRHWLGN